MKRMDYLFVIIIVICILYLTKFISFSAYESLINGNVNSDVANWNIKVNNNNITDVQSKEIEITDVTWIGEHTMDNKAAPGSVGVITLTIDPSDTDVAIWYDITIEDSSVDSEQLLTVTDVSSTNSTITNNDGVYSGIISLSDINNNVKPVIKINVSWVNDEANNERDSAVGDISTFLKINFKAQQYLGDDSDEETS